MGGILSVVKSIRHTTRKGSRPLAAFITEITSRATRNRTSRYVAPAGVDSAPLSGDYVFEVPTRDGTGVSRAVGYADPDNANIAKPGEVRLYARDPDTHAIVGTLYMENDGLITLSNVQGATIILKKGGGVEINGAVFDSGGRLTDDSPGGGIRLDTHTHAQPDDGGGDSEAETNAPTPGS